jgi:acetyl-CoA C-acetyltransferase
LTGNEENVMSNGLGGAVAIIGTGTIKFGENSGGLKSCGHPIGSSGIRMINNIHDQLVGRGGRMPVPGADMGLAHNLGGPGSVSAVAVLSQP